MKLRWIVIVGVFILILIAAAALILIPAPQKANAPGNGTGQPAGIADLIEVTSPLPNQKTASPLEISGKARGPWYFEASAPIELRDANGTIIAQTHIDAQGNWMTEDFVPFKATVTYPAQPAGSKGTLILKNDNPSGDPARDKQVVIPVVF